MATFDQSITSPSHVTRYWYDFADQVLDGHQVTQDEAVEMLVSADDALLDLLGGAYRVRRRYFGNNVQLYF